MEKNYSSSVNDLNQYTIDTKSFKLIDTEVEEFNEIYQLCLQSDMNTIVRTEKGTLAKSYKNCYAWDISATRTLARLTIINGSECWCFKCGGGINHDNDESEISGSRSFQRFKDLCKKVNIDLKKYEITNGKEVKEEIEKPMIKINDECKNIVLENVHHLDYNSSYPAGLVNTHPEFRTVIEWLYDKRKTDKRAKAILTHVIGYMQSVSRCGAKYAELSRDAINDNNDRIREMTDRLIKNGYEIVGYNTDGIWYKGEKEYHGEGEGKKLGEWKNDHINCKFRAKSDGAYEFIENGVYSAVYRGCTTLDKIKSRSEWVWGDIYKAQELIYFWEDKRGFVKYEN